jgi:glycosyltransferase involved in cell wall biosynthesis
MNERRPTMHRPGPQSSMVERRGPRVVFGLPTANGEAHLAEAIESLLAQTFVDWAIVVVDDASTDRTLEIVRRYAAYDGRISVERHERRLGLAGNWRSALERAVQLHPDLEYFAWASDHDVWHRDWLMEHVGELDRHPEAVLAYPYTMRITEGGADAGAGPRVFSTAGIEDPRERLRRAALDRIKAGDVIYGLMRADALRRCGPFPLVVHPDRFTLMRLSAEGEFRQIPRFLWARRYRTGVSITLARQRRSLHPGRVPIRAYAPWPVSHYLLVRPTLVSDGSTSGPPPVQPRDHLRAAVDFAFRDWRDEQRETARRRRRRRTRRYRKLRQSVVKRLPRRAKIAARFLSRRLGLGQHAGIRSGDASRG